MERLPWEKVKFATVGGPIEEPAFASIPKAPPPTSAAATDPRIKPLIVDGRLDREKYLNAIREMREAEYAAGVKQQRQDLTKTVEDKGIYDTLAGFVTGETVEQKKQIATLAQKERMLFSPEVQPGVRLDPRPANLAATRLYNSADTAKGKAEVAVDYGNLEGKVVPYETFEEVAEPDWYESLPGWGDLLAVTQRAPWVAGAWLAEGHIPEGSLREDIFAKTFAAYKQAGPASAIPGGVNKDFDLEGGRNLARAINDGSLLETWRSKRDNTFVDYSPFEGEWKIPKADGIDVHNAAYPPDMVEDWARTEEKSGNDLAAQYLRWSNQPWVREGTGLSYEVVFDAANLLGPAAGAAKVTTKSGKIYVITRGAAKAASAAAEGLGDASKVNDMRKAIVALGEGGAEAAEAEQVLEAALKGLRTKAKDVAERAKVSQALVEDPEVAVKAAADALAEANRLRQQVLAGPMKSAQAIRLADDAVQTAESILSKVELEAKAGKWGKLAASRDLKASQAATAKVADLEAVIGRRAKAVEQGTFAVHAPFSDTTRYLLKGDPLGAPGRKVRELGKRYTDDFIAPAKLKLANHAEDLLTGGEKLALALDAVGQPMAKGKRIILDLTNELFGSRLYQPLHLASRLQKAFGDKFGESALFRVPAELWENYQRSLTRHMDQVGELDSKATGFVQRLTEKAGDVVLERRGLAAAEVAKGERMMAAAQTAAQKVQAQTVIERGQRWGSKSYNVEDVLMEAGAAMESGSGLLTTSAGPKLRALMGEIQAIKDDVAKQFDNVTTDELDQAAVAYMRHAQGSIEAERKLVSDLVWAATRGPAEAAKLINKYAPTGWSTDPKNVEKFIRTFDKHAKEVLVRGGTKEEMIQSTHSIKFLDELGWVQSKLKEVRPRLVFPEGTERATRAIVKDWERALWTGLDHRFKGKQTNVENILAAMGAIRWAPGVTGDEAKIYDAYLERYGQVVGKRLGDLPADIMPVIEEFRSLVMSYEDMYTKAGILIAKDPLQRLVDWGVVDYVPHITPSDLLKSKLGQRIDDDLISAAIHGGDGIDVRLSTQMDSSKRRYIQGTIEEINAMAARGENAVGFTLDPTHLLGRYMQSNRAIAAADMLAMLDAGGLMRRFANANDAAKEGYVPLFLDSVNRRDIDYLNGTREDMVKQGILDELLAGRAKGKAQGGKSSPFASWKFATTELYRQAAVDDALRYARAKAIAGGGDFIPQQVYLEEFDRLVGEGLTEEMARQKALNAVAGKVNQLAEGAHIIEGSWLHPASFKDPITQMYLPATVVQSLETVFGSGEAMFGGKLAPIGKALRWADNFYKKRVTIMIMAFTARNAASNAVNNILDLGLYGALHPQTNMTAATMASRIQIAEAYGGGSWTEAVKAIEKGRAKGKVDKLYRSMLKGLNAATWDEAKATLDELGHTVDLGDGIWRSVDEAIAVLRSNGVVGNRLGFEADTLELYNGAFDRLAKKGWKDIVTGWASNIEDAATLILPMSVGGIPVALPKKWGEAVARSVENQARIANFVGNVRRGGSFDQAAEHVNKFLFDYDDLTYMQREYMRFIFPFWTWTSKNVKLYLDMAAESPAKLAIMQKFLLDDGPRAMAAFATGEPQEDIITPEEVAGRHPQAWSRVRFPTGRPNQWVEGVGLPVESFAEQMSMLSTVPRWAIKGSEVSPWLEDDRRDVRMRLAANGNFWGKFGYEMSSGNSLFRGAPATEMRPKYLQGAIDAVTVDSDIPIFGYEGQAFLNSMAGKVAAEKDGKVYIVTPNAAAIRANHLLSVGPWARWQSASWAFSEQKTYTMSSIADPGQGTTGEDDWNLWLRFADAYLGVDRTNEIPEWVVRARAKKVEEAYNKMLKPTKTLSTFENTYLDTNKPH